MKRKYKTLIMLVLSGVFVIIMFRFKIVKEIFSVLFISFIIAYTLKPFQKKLIENKMNKHLSGFLLIGFFSLVIVVLFVVLIPSILNESLTINNTFNEINSYMQKFYEKIKLSSNSKLIDDIFENMNKKFSMMFLQTSNKFLSVFFNIFEKLISIFVIPIIVYYFLADGDKIQNRMFVFIPCDSRKVIKKISIHIDRILTRYILSQILLSIIVSVITFIVLIIFKIKFPVILSFLNGIFNIIPYFGPIFGIIPIVLVALLQSPKTALIVTACLYILQLIEGNILSPKIIGDSVSMHPLIVIILLIIGEKLGGFFGMVLAIPVGVVIKVIYEDLNYYLF